MDGLRHRSLSRGAQELFGPRTPQLESGGRLTLTLVKSFLRLLNNPKAQGLTRLAGSQVRGQGTDIPGSSPKTLECVSITQTCGLCSVKSCQTEATAPVSSALPGSSHTSQDATPVPHWAVGAKFPLGPLLSLSFNPCLALVVRLACPEVSPRHGDSAPVSVIGGDLSW